MRFFSVFFAFTANRAGHRLKKRVLDESIRFVRLERAAAIAVENGRIHFCYVTTIDGEQSD